MLNNKNIYFTREGEHNYRSAFAKPRVYQIVYEQRVPFWYNGCHTL
nr:MAG TPA: hypothetical protein [Inoviridae sp.]